MHKIFSFIFSICVLQIATSQSVNKTFSFVGEIPGMSNGSLYLSYIDSTNHYITDTSKIVDGKFYFSGSIFSPQIANLYAADSKGGTDDPHFTYIALEGKIKGSFVKNDFKNHKIAGLQNTNDYNLYEQQLSLLNKKWKVVLAALAAYNNGVEKERNYPIVSQGLPRYQQEKQQLNRQFIRQHPQSYVSASLLQLQASKLSLDSLKIYYNRLTPVVRTGLDGYWIGNFIRKEEAIAVGKPAPDFMQPDSSGAPVWLHDFKGQYVLLDVWASWCAPCREEHPYLRQAYARYKTKGFTILSLSIDRKEDKQAWLAAIQKDTLTWPQLCDFTHYQNKVVNDYNVVGKGIPVNFLIDPQGIIVAMNLRGEAVEKKLVELGLPNPSKGAATEP